MEPQEPTPATPVEQRQLTQREFLGGVATSPQPLPAAWEPAGLADAWAMAQVLARSELVPKALRGKPADLWIVLWNAKELGMTSMDGLNHLHVVHGRIGTSAQLMQRRCLAHPACQRFEVIEADSKHAVVEYQRKGNEARRVEFTIDQAKAAGLLGKADSAWNNWTEDMLVARAISRGARRGFPDALGPVQYLPDELRSLPADDGAEPTAEELVQQKTEKVIERVQENTRRGRGRPRKETAAGASDAPDPIEVKGGAQQAAEQQPPPRPVGPEALAAAERLHAMALDGADDALARHEQRAAEVRQQRGATSLPHAAALGPLPVPPAVNAAVQVASPSGAQRVLNSPPPAPQPAPSPAAAPAAREPRLSEEQIDALEDQAEKQKYRAGGAAAFRDFVSRMYKVRLEKVPASAYDALVEELAEDARVLMDRG